jgi:hypothetical protein
MTVAIPPARRRIPLVLKLAVTAFTAVLVPVYWRDYGPQNFLEFCDVALLLLVPAMWLENRLLISMQAVAVLLPQGLWVIDITCHLLGFRLMGMTDYMFDSVNYPLFTRLLSTFHGWVPILLVWLVYRTGYDRRAIWAQTILAVSLLLVSYFCFVPPGTEPAWRAFNLNYVFGITEHQTQAHTASLRWLAILIVGIPGLFYLPAHLLLGWLFGSKKRQGLRPQEGSLVGNAHPA